MGLMRWEKTQINLVLLELRAEFSHFRVRQNLLESLLRHRLRATPSKFLIE